MATPPQTSQFLQRAMDKGKLKIHNLVPSLERTYLAIGTTIGKYKILEEIDRGGMAVVYKALQLDLDREVALKVLPANITINRRFVDRFLSEAHAVAKLSHSNIVNIHEVAVEDNVYFLAMDYIPGVNLYYFLNYKKPKLIDVLEITARLADALAYAHGQRIVHRDLKLNNVIMRDNTMPVLIDFGLAKALESDEGTITKTGEIMGSPAYMAPERLFGKNCDARSDICSLGIMLYEMLTFKNPYLDPRSIHQTTMNVIEANPIPPHKLIMWLPPEIEAITLKAMSKDPDKRYQTMAEFAADIRRYQKGEPVLANPPSLVSTVRHYVRKRWPFLAIIGLTCLFAGFYAFTSYERTKKERPYWQLMYQKYFTGTVIGDEWSQYPGGRLDKKNLWIVHGGELISPSTASFIRYERPITRDARIEFDIHGVENDFFNAGFFLYGSCPDSAYLFHIYKGAMGECGISYSGNDFLFSNYNPLSLTPAKKYHVIVECKESNMSFYINDVYIGRIADCFPPRGKDHQSLGFFVDGASCAIDNIKLFKYAVPMLASASLVANRFAERGDFSAALEEYADLLNDNISRQSGQEILLRMAECEIRLGHLLQAQEALESSKLKNLGVADVQKGLFLKGLIQDRLGNHAVADSMYAKVGLIDGEQPVFQAALTVMILKALKYNSQNELDKAMTILVGLAKKYPKNAHDIGRACLVCMNDYVAKNNTDAAIDASQTILKYFTNDPDVLSRARVALAVMYLSKRKKAQAVDLLNQSIASYTKTEAVWQAWMELAGVYRYDGNYNDAFTTYKKIWEDCPKSLETAWMARLKMAEMTPFVSDVESPQVMFNDVIKSQHPFVLPRAMAKYYAGVESEADFNMLWNQMMPENPLYLLCFANKAILDHQKALAEEYLSVLEDSVPPSSWIQMQIVAQHSAVRNLK